MKPSLHTRVPRALTLIEAMATIAILGILVALVAPSMREMIGMQRLRSVSAELLSDMQYARSEAIARNQAIGIVVREAAGSMSCYTIFASTTNPLQFTSLDASRCDCTAGAGSACTGTQRELRTVQVPRALELGLRRPPQQPSWMGIDPVTGAVRLWNISSEGLLTVIPAAFCVDVVRDTGGRIRAMAGLGGRATLCTPDGSVRGLEACPPDDPNAGTCMSWG